MWWWRRSRVESLAFLVHSLNSSLIRKGCWDADVNMDIGEVPAEWGHIMLLSPVFPSLYCDPWSFKHTQGWYTHCSTLITWRDTKARKAHLGQNRKPSYSLGVFGDSAAFSQIPHFFFFWPGVCLRWDGWCLKRKGYSGIYAFICYLVQADLPRKFPPSLFFESVSIFKTPGLSPSLPSRRTLQTGLLKMLKVNQPTA